jgi:3alpha(or 20beta)-hydroxysteroid dehydrogenase
MSDDRQLEGKVALITGGARGQGEADAKRLARSGAKVVLTDINDQLGEKVAAAIGSAATYMHHDVSSESDWSRIVAGIENLHGRLDVVVNNAGIFKPRSIEQTTVADFDENVRINQLGVFLGIKMVIDLMRRSGGGSIINISSVAGLKAFADHLAYSGAKWAVRGMTKVAAVELAPYNIRVNTIFPGITDTPMNQGNPPEVNQAAVDATPLKRKGRPEEIAELVEFLASARSSYITGADIAHDGGWSA